HAAMELPGGANAKIVVHAIRAVRATALKALRELQRDLLKVDSALTGIGLVAASNSDPAKLANPHIRAHAMEGRLIWKVLEEAAGIVQVPSVFLLERGVLEAAASALRRTEPELKGIVGELGRVAGRPWGQDEKTAALAAMIALSEPSCSPKATELRSRTRPNRSEKDI